MGLTRIHPICQLQYEQFTFPMPVDNIPKFEKLNGLCINVFGYNDKDHITPLSRTKLDESKFIAVV